MTSGSYEGAAFCLGVFECDGTDGGMSSARHYPWVWVDCPGAWDYLVVKIPRDQSDLRWRAVLNRGAVAAIFLPISQALSGAPGFTFFVDSGRLGLVATQAVQDRSGVYARALDCFAARWGIGCLDEACAYSDYEQLMGEKLALLAHVRSLLASAYAYRGRLG